MVSVSVVGKAKGGWPLPRDIFLSPHMPTCLPPTATPTRDLQDETWTLPAFPSHQVLRVPLLPTTKSWPPKPALTCRSQEATLLSTHGPHPTATHAQCSCMGGGAGRGPKEQNSGTIRFKPQLYYFLPGLCGPFTKPIVPQFPHM